MYYKARWYDPVLGRFAQADSIVPGAGNPLAWDRYAYVGNNPVIRNDSTGHCWGPLLVFCLAVAGYITANGPQIVETFEFIVASSYIPPEEPKRGPNGEDVSIGVIYIVPEFSPLEIETPLFRSMMMAEDGLPLLADSKNALGVVTEGIYADIVPDSNGIVYPDTGGMSVNIDPFSVPKNRLPLDFGGTSKTNQMWVIDKNSLPDNLVYVPDHGGHGTIQPATPDFTEAFRSGLAGLRELWKRVTIK